MRLPLTKTFQCKFLLISNILRGILVAAKGLVACQPTWKFLAYLMANFNSNSPILAIRKFIKVWTGRGYEKGDTQSFWYQLLNDVFGVDTPSTYISFEKRLDGSFSDGYIPKTRVIIEQKSLGVDLNKPERQSDGSVLTPYEQALRYSNKLSYSQRARWIIVSDFKSFIIHDMEHPKDTPIVVELQNLEKQYYLLSFLVEDIDSKLIIEQELSVKAGELIASLYDALKEQFIDKKSVESITSLNALCVRLVFCLYAEDSSLFGYTHGKFYNYLSSFKPTQMRNALMRLFKVLNTPVEDRDPYLEDELASFPFVNGGLFDSDNQIIPQFNDKIAHILLKKCSRGFCWADISPTIFGAIVEDTMNPETRDINCPHYTSVDNIHKVIDPLFLNQLYADFNDVLKKKADQDIIDGLLSLQIRLSNIRILDPACGSGNFLTESYLSIRRLENKILRILCQSYQVPKDTLKILVPIENFYGIEINDFAVSVAKAALWIAEAQCFIDTKLFLNNNITFLPLKSLSNIHEQNALRIDWNVIIPSEKLSYIIGNPPFVGKKSLSDAQRKDIYFAAKDIIKKRIGNLDYVAAWFIKCAEYIQHTQIQCALVSTVNITRGEQVHILWPVLISEFGINIIFGYQAFKWYNEAKRKVQVHCTIVGFCAFNYSKSKFIVTQSNERINATAINPYLRVGKPEFIQSRKNPICEVPCQKIGNKPIDGGFYIFTSEEMDAFLKVEPNSKPYFKQYIGAEEWINNKERFILWLKDCSPAILRRLPKCKERIEAVRQYRLKLGGQTAKLADFPTHMHVCNLPDADFVVIPEVSSEKRYYIPFNFVKLESSVNQIYSNLVKLICPATLCHFGILQSRIHMVWTKAFCGFKDRRIRYSTEVVYNNFPWPEVSEPLKKQIEEASNQILQIRNKYSDCSIADLYDDSVMPSDLLLAHRILDNLVLQAYNFPTDISDDDILDSLFSIYIRLTK